MVVVDTLSATSGESAELSVSLTGRMFTTEPIASATPAAAATPAGSTTATTVATNTIEAG